MTMSTITGCLSDKMTINQQAGAPLNYVLHLGEHGVDMNTEFLKLSKPDHSFEMMWF